jgi:uridine kinase
MPSRKTVLEHVAIRAASLGADRPMIAIDGVDGSGKTTFADELAPYIEAYGRRVVRAGVDGFHNPRAIRYRRGKADAEGFFLDSYNYDALKRNLIEPFQSGRSFQTAMFDHTTDLQVSSARIEPDDRAVLLIDGIFLHRDELFGLWDHSVFLDVPFAVSYARMASRDGSDPNPLAKGNHRYYEGQGIYFRTCHPQDRATILIDNSDIESPKILKDRSIAECL